MRFCFVSLLLALSACGPSEEECRDACEEAADACTESDVMDKCIEACQENADADQVENAKENCGGFGYCSLGLCCSGFYYDDAGKERNCESD
jgi:hypothetical protein